MRKATIFRRRGKYIVHASSKTTEGVWILWEPVLAVLDDEGQVELGRKVVSALDGSRPSVPHPRDWKAVLSPLLTISGVKSWATFCKSAACVEVEEEEGHVALIPTRNLGAEGGFEPETSKRVLTTRHDPTQLGALAAALLS